MQDSQKPTRSEDPCLARQTYRAPRLVHLDAEATRGGFGFGPDVNSSSPNLIS